MFVPKVLTGSRLFCAFLSISVQWNGTRAVGLKPTDIYNKQENNRGNYIQHREPREWGDARNRVGRVMQKREAHIHSRTRNSFKSIKICVRLPVGWRAQCAHVITILLFYPWATCAPECVHSKSFRLIWSFLIHRFRTRLSLAITFLPFQCSDLHSIPPSAERECSFLRFLSLNPPHNGTRHMQISLLIVAVCVSCDCYCCKWLPWAVLVCNDHCYILRKSIWHHVLAYGKLHLILIESQLLNTIFHLLLPPLRLRLRADLIFFLRIYFRCVSIGTARLTCRCRRYL